ncbi:MAG: S1 RNA-binding domain-containing protein [Candidatus Magasanikbacteria bacterium]|nr:S1 RNA-binding domain-containing protein [Candidatus Magasanikbacteria bacterium]
MTTLKEKVEEEIKDRKANDFKQLINDSQFTKVPKKGEMVKGFVLSVNRSLVRIDFPGLKTGVVRGEELYESPDYLNLKSGDEIDATVIELENENGEMELSFKEAGQRKSWDALAALLKESRVVSVKIKDANRGGLLAVLDSVIGFLPVSQLSPEHYPRVAGGDKNKILERLRSYIGEDFNVKVIDVAERENKLIVSEKAAWEEEKKNLLNSYKVGDVVDGTITALTDFGAFVRFGEVEGLVHISEIAWQRLDHPRDVLKVGEEVKAQIIQIDGAKIFLSIKKLATDPWTKIEEKYAVGQKVKGKVIKVTPFGLFVELDKDIHGLAHLSGLGSLTSKELTDSVKEGEDLDFEIISLEPAKHRLGLKMLNWEAIVKK